MSTTPLDLFFTREIDISPADVWQAWTEPALLVKWFTPAPWQTVDCKIDLRPGGEFSTVMRSPEGQEFPGTGCYLEIVPIQKLVWTNALLPGYRPAPVVEGSHGAFEFTAIITLEMIPKGTRYSARVLHADEAGKQQHEAMGFHEGWGTALDQLVAMVKGTLA